MRGIKEVDRLVVPDVESGSLALLSFQGDDGANGWPRDVTEGIDDNGRRGCSLSITPDIAWAGEDCADV